MGIPELAVFAFILLSTIVVLWPVARICRRVGFSPWLALLVLVPVGNVLLLWFLAYAPWPIDASTSATRTAPVDPAARRSTSP